ncbi:MAG: hypothetical protein ACYCZN_15310 [Candidatus Dormibacteria bacterium]
MRLLSCSSSAALGLDLGAGLPSGPDPQDQVRRCMEAEAMAIHGDADRPEPGAAKTNGDPG